MFCHQLPVTIWIQLFTGPVEEQEVHVLEEVLSEKEKLVTAGMYIFIGVCSCEALVIRKKNGAIMESSHITTHNKI